MFIFFPIVGLVQDTEYSSLCYTVGAYCLPILYIMECICSSQIPNLFPLWWGSFPMSFLWIYFCFVNKIIYIFLQFYIEQMLYSICLSCIYIYTHHIFFIYSSVDGYLGCFHVLAILNNTAVNTGVHTSFWIRVFSEYMPRSKTVGSYGISIFSFLRNPP